MTIKWYLTLCLSKYLSLTLYIRIMNTKSPVMISTINRLYLFWHIPSVKYFRMMAPIRILMVIMHSTQYRRLTKRNFISLPPPQCTSYTCIWLLFIIPCIFLIKILNFLFRCMIRFLCINSLLIISLYIIIELNRMS